MFDSGANFFGISFRININPDTSVSPCIAVTKNGKFAICWLDVNNVKSIIP